MKKRLEGKTVIVTGAARGIGKAIALRLAQEGANVTVLDVDLDTAKKTAEEINALGQKALAVKADVTKSSEVKEAVEKTLKEFGKIDILVNNAGWDQFEPFIQSKEETWDKVIGINYKGPIICSRAVLDDMVARKSGKIISISSDAGKVGSSFEAVYSGAKAGIIAFSKTLARELARYNINVNVVCPGPTATETALEGAKSNETIAKAVEGMIKTIPLKRMAKPEEIAACVAFLASEDASFITGQAISVNGGLTMQ